MKTVLIRILVADISIGGGWLTSWRMIWGEDGLMEIANWKVDQEEGWSRAFEEIWKVWWRVEEEKRRRERQRGRRTGGGNVCLGLVPILLALKLMTKKLNPRDLAGNQTIKRLVPRVPAWNRIIWVPAQDEIRDHCWKRQFPIKVIVSNQTTSEQHCWEPNN